MQPLDASALIDRRNSYAAALLVTARPFVGN